LPLTLQAPLSATTGEVSVPVCMKKTPPPKLAEFPVNLLLLADSVLPALSATAPPRYALLPDIVTFTSDALTTLVLLVLDCSSRAPPRSDATLAAKAELVALMARLPYANTAPPDTALLPHNVVPPEMRIDAPVVLETATLTAPPKPAPKLLVAVSPGSKDDATSETEFPDNSEASSAKAGAVNGLM
jgi:hypothetical protein